MSDHQILNAQDHGALRVTLDAGANLGDGVMASLAVPDEFRRIACEYPILYRFDPASSRFSALALFGFEEAENLFLTDGRWDASVRPLAMDIGPFLVGRAASDGAGAQVHVNMAHPRISNNGEGVLVFDQGGQPTPYLEEIAEKLGMLDESHRASVAFFEALTRYDLLEPFSMDITLNNGASHRLVGYHLINEERLAQLEPGALAELHAAGHLAALYYSTASLGNLGKLVARKNARIHG